MKYDDQLKERGERRIVNRLRKLGVDVPSRSTGSRSAPWNEDDLYVYERPLHIRQAAIKVPSSPPPSPPSSPSLPPLRLFP